MNAYFTNTRSPPFFFVIHLIIFFTDANTVADPGIDRQGGADFFQEFILTTAGKASLLYALEGSGGMLHRKILKSKASNDAFWSKFRPKYGRFFCFWDPERGGGGGAPVAPSGSATEISLACMIYYDSCVSVW